jgi:hypothetical protein
MIPTPPPADWVKQSTDYDRLDYWTVPFQWYLDQLNGGHPFALARWDDGAWPVVLGDEGQNCDRHPYTPELRRDLTQTLTDIQAHGAPYLLGIQESFVARAHPANERVHTWMVAADLRIEWVSSDVFHRASIRGELGPLIQAYKDRGVILVGPERLGALKSYFPIRRHVRVPLLNCHAAVEGILRRTREAMDSQGTTPIVSVSASMSTKYMVHELNKTHPEATIIDVGSVWEPYVGVACRKYHGTIVKRLRRQKIIGAPPTLKGPLALAPSQSTIPSVRATLPTVAVFTACIGTSTDTLRTPTVIPEGIEYFCITDKALPTSSVWQPVGVPVAPDPALAARRAKVRLHETVRRVAPTCDAYLWIDAAYELHIDPRALLPALLRADLAVLVHPSRTSIVEEAAAIRRRKDLAFPELSALLDRQVDRYLGEQYPDKVLSSTGLIMRRHDLRTARFNEVWWSEIQAHRHTRDQMSFDYAVWKRSMAITYLEGSYVVNPYATWHDRTT